MIAPAYERWSVDSSSGSRHLALRALDMNGLRAFLSERQDDAVLVLDALGTIIDVNAAVTRRTQYDSDAVVGRSLSDIVEPRFRARIGAMIDDAREGHSTRTEAVGVKRDGALCELAITAIPLTDDTRTVVGILAITQNLSEAAAAQEERARNDQLMALAGRVAGFSGWSLDLRTHQISWSQLHGNPTHPRPETLAELLMMVDASDAARLERSLARIGTTGRLLSTAVRFTSDEGKPRIVRLVAEQVLDRLGEIVAIHGAAHDITEQVHRDETVRRIDRMESLGSFASGIAHDLNNVLTPILMAAQLLRASEVDAVQQETLQTIEDAARRGTDMVRQVLSFSTGVAGRRDDVDLAELLQELARLFSESLPSRIQLRVAAADDDLHVRGDSTQLLQVLTNLCANARDAIDGDGVIAVDARRESAPDQSRVASDGETVVIEVVDTGSGMSADTVDRLFDPFFSTKAPGSGTGLGLSMAAAIIKSHGGTITAHSDGHRGSRMVIRLPVDDRVSPALTGTTTSELRVPSESQTQHTDGVTVLVVDDEPAIRALTRRALESEGYDVIDAADGQYAVDQLRRDDVTVHAMVTDVTMPRMDGHGLLEWVAHHRPSLPVVVMSGREARSTGSEVTGEGAHAHLDKPFTLESLRDGVRTVLRRDGVKK